MLVDHQETVDEVTTTKDDLVSCISGVQSRQEKSEKTVLKTDKTEAASEVENVEKVDVARCKFTFFLVQLSSSSKVFMKLYKIN